MNKNGRMEEVKRIVSRTCRRAGSKVLLGQEEWHAKWVQGKARVEAEMRMRGALQGNATSVSCPLEME